jgi:CheY-like chemotaxis protein
VQQANDGLEAVALAAKFQPDVIVLDIGMPKLNGYEACRLIREQPWGKKAVMIASTGWGQEEDRRRSKEAGFDHHLVKPIDPDVLERLLGSLQGSAAR